MRDRMQCVLFCITWLIALLLVQNVSLACSEGMLRALKEEGLNPKQIQLICEKAKLYDRTDSTQTGGLPTVEQLAEDLGALSKKHRLTTLGDFKEYPVADVCDLMEFKKTNGMQKSDGYLTEFSCTASFKMNVYIHADTLYLSKPSNVTTKHIAPGDKDTMIGYALFEKTEKGWRIAKFEIRRPSGGILMRRL